MNRGFTKIELIVTVTITMVLALLILPYANEARTRSQKTRCAGKLQSIGVAMILYAKERGYFPHVKGRKENHKEEDVSRAFRSLMYHGYLNDPDLFICTASDDLSVSLEKDQNPRSFAWKGTRRGKRSFNPLTEVSMDPPVTKNTELSYTYVKRALKHRTRLYDTMLAADKGLREKGRSGGNHQDGLNVLYGDGQVRFIPAAETQLLERMIDRLVFPGLVPSACGCDEPAHHSARGKK